MALADSAGAAPRRTHLVLARSAFHPIAFSIAYVLNVWLGTSMSVFAVGRALIIAPLVAAGLVLLGWLLLRDVRRGGLFATALLAVLVFGREVMIVISNTLAALPAWQIVALIGLLTLLGVTAAIVLRRAGLGPRGLDAWTRVLDVLAGALLVAVLLTAVASGAIGQTIADLKQGVDLDAVADRPSDPTLPDIYLIFLDGYPRADVLADHYGYDNTAFLAGLEDRGLDVAKESHSNYTLTQFALVSMFNVDLLQDIPELQPVISGERPAEPTSRRLLNDNPILDGLQERGYLTVALAGSYEDVAVRQADIFLETGHMNEVEWQLISRTFIVDLLDAALPTFFADQQRAFIDSSFDQAARVARDRSLGPRFVLAHVFAPHTPFVFGANGEAVDIPELRRAEDTAAAGGFSMESFGERLRGQVSYVNGRTLELIDTIQASSEEPPVIIVMSDHGPRPRSLDPDHPDPELVRERFGTLFAASTPGRDEVFPDDVAPAQIMGRLMKAYFGMDLGEPGSGIFASGQNRYEFFGLGDAPPTPAPSR
jgi:hypothetical protein